MRRPTFSGAAATAKAKALLDGIGGGRLLIYAGEQPESPEVEATAAHPLLAELALAEPAYDRIDRGRARLLLAEDSAPGLETGTPTWFRISAWDGTPVMDGSAGPGAGPEPYDMLVGDVDADGEVRVRSFVYVERRQ